MLALTGLGSAGQAASLPALIVYTDYAAGGLFSFTVGSPHSDHLFYAVTGLSGAGSPSWAPDGQRIAFWATDKLPTQTAQGTYRIVIADRTGRVISSEARGLPWISALDWSPDGKKIAYECAGHPDAVNPAEICVLDVATGAHKVLGATKPDGIQPVGRWSGSNLALRGRLSWSPKGNLIVFDAEHVSDPCPNGVTQQCLRLDIGVLNVDTGELSLLTHVAGTDFAGGPDFSPDGSEIVYWDSTKGILVMSPSGGHIRTVVPRGELAPTDDPVPTWSPDGKEILFGSMSHGANYGHTDLFTVSAHGGALTQVTDTPTDNGFATWAPILTLCTVPPLKGQTLADATRLIKRAGCALGKVIGPKKNRNKLHVVGQNPGANKNVSSGTKVNVKLG